MLQIIISSVCLKEFKQLEIRWQRLPGIEKGWERAPILVPPSVIAMPSRDISQPGCTRWNQAAGSLSFPITLCSLWYSGHAVGTQYSSLPPVFPLEELMLFHYCLPDGKSDSGKDPDG